LNRDRQITVLIVTHEAVGASRADRVIHSVDGLVAGGSRNTKGHA
jgi:ABC-type lipoprotein export system ATPase subunit